MTPAEIITSLALLVTALTALLKELRHWRDRKKK